MSRLKKFNCQHITLTVLTAGILSQWMPALRPLWLVAVSLLMGIIVFPLLERYLQKILHFSYTRHRWQRIIFSAAEAVWSMLLCLWVLFIGRLASVDAPQNIDQSHLSTAAFPATAAVPTPVYPSTCSLLE